MLEVTDNDDGTKTLSFNSGELRAIPGWLMRERLRKAKKVQENARKLQEIADGPQAKAILSFVKSVVA